MPAPSPAAPGRYRRQILANTFVGAFANGWTILLSLVSIPLLLRGMGVEAFGLWSVLLTFSATTGWLSLADLGLGIATVRSAASASAVDDERRLGAVLGTALAMYLVLGVACGAVFALAGPVLLPAIIDMPDGLRPGVETATRLFGALAVPEILGLGLLASLEGIQRLDLARATDSLRRTLVAGATIIAALGGHGINGVALAALGATVIATAVQIVVLRRRVSVPLRVQAGEARRLGRYSGELGVLRGTGVLHRTMDRLIVGIFVGPSGVVVVEIATQLQNGVSAVLSATTQVSVSSASWLRARADHDRLAELLLRGTKYSTLITWIAAAVLGALGLPVIRTWVGDDYAAAYPLLVLALAFLVTQAPVAVGSNLLQGVGNIRGVLIGAIAGVLVNLAVSLVLVPRVGSIGSFVGTLVGGSVVTPILLRHVLHETRTTLPVLVREAVVPSLPPALAAGAAAAAVLVLPIHDRVRIVVGSVAALAVAGTLAWRWTIDADERRELRSIVAPDRSPASATDE